MTVSNSIPVSLKSTTCCKIRSSTCQIGMPYRSARISLAASSSISLGLTVSKWISQLFSLDLGHKVSQFLQEWIYARRIEQYCSLVGSLLQSLGDVLSHLLSIFIQNGIMFDDNEAVMKPLPRLSWAGKLWNLFVSPTQWTFDGDGSVWLNSCLWRIEPWKAVGWGYD